MDPGRGARGAGRFWSAVARALSELLVSCKLVGGPRCIRRVWHEWGGSDEHNAVLFSQ